MTLGDCVVLLGVTVLISFLRFRGDIVLNMGLPGI